jgi:hypothetical protein
MTWQVLLANDAPRFPLEARVALGTTLFHLGEYAAGWTHLQ